MRIDIKTPTVILGILLIPAVILLTLQTLERSREDDERTRTYTGTYLPPGGQEPWEVEAADGRIVLRAPGGRVYRLGASGDRGSFASGSVHLRFTREPEGKVEGFTLTEGGGPARTFVRIPAGGEKDPAPSISQLMDRSERR